MQPADAKLSRTSLLLSLKRYSAAVHDMEQTVLIPSLLREVPSDEAADRAEDLYESYLALKAVRNTVESGLVAADDGKALRRHLEPLLDADPEVLFHFHLRGLFSIMANLTQRSQTLTAKYMDLIGISS
ncbi:mid1-interacting protein 1-B-like [Denticeps clupeoides]|uniref:mid1-interacting protein 1-B-like n=1 Tax=Denticeps clupeoides TaxID=299321 RepID=UPI0010A2E97D|nr:mid1-interacting protein 1-B-like [Denticeps clupeoides]XP_028856279.1 mid1-interacting protein 1-B-like [Denticeps clupeoides]